MQENTSVANKNILQIDGIVLDAKNGQLIGPEGIVHQLTPIECRLLRVFMLHPGEIMSRDYLMQSVWGLDSLENTRTLDVHVSWLRKKIERNPHYPQYLRTIRGIGYKFGFE